MSPFVRNDQWARARESSDQTLISPGDGALASRSRCSRFVPAFCLHLHILLSAGTAAAMIWSLLSSLGAAFWCFQVTAALDRSSLISQLKSPSLGLSPGTRIFFPSDSHWVTETTQRWTVHDAPSYVASIRPALESDVQKIV